MEKTIYKVIVGLGNPGQQFSNNRHNAGFLVIDALAELLGGSWKTKESMEYATVVYKQRSLLLIKPQTFMNSSGQVWSYIAKQGIKTEEMLILHDELELPFGRVAHKIGGSSKGHNGLKSFISFASDGFGRIRFGIGRPVQKEFVPTYVLQNFREPKGALEDAIAEAVALILTLL